MITGRSESAVALVQRRSARLGLAMAGTGFAAAVGLLWLIGATAPCTPYCVPQNGPYFAVAALAYFVAATFSLGGLYLTASRAEPRTKPVALILMVVLLLVYVSAFLYSIVTEL